MTTISTETAPKITWPTKTSAVLHYGSPLSSTTGVGVSKTFQRLVILSGTANINRKVWISGAEYLISSIVVNASSVGTYTLTADGVSIGVGDTVTAGQLMELTAERATLGQKNTMSVTINGVLDDTVYNSTDTWQYVEWQNLNGFANWKQDNLALTDTGLICTETSGFCWAQGLHPFHYDAEIRWVAGNNVYVGFARSEITPTSVNDLEFAVRDGGNNIRVMESGSIVYSKVRRGAETFGIRVGANSLEYLVNDTVVYTTAITINSTDEFYLYVAYTATTGSDVTGVNFMNGKGLKI